MISRTYLARVGEAAPAQPQQIVIHCCRAWRPEWRETSKRNVLVRVSER
jgi:hypothetical protein